MLSQVMGNKLVGREEVNRLEAFIAERFLALLPRYLADSNSIYWGSKLVTLTDTLLTSSPHLHHLAQMLSTSP